MMHDHCLIAGCHEIARFRVRARVDMDGAKYILGLGRAERSLRVCEKHVTASLLDCATRAAEDIRIQVYVRE